MSLLDHHLWNKNFGVVIVLFEFGATNFNPMYQDSHDYYWTDEFPITAVICSFFERYIDDIKKGSKEYNELQDLKKYLRNSIERFPNFEVV